MRRNLYVAWALSLALHTYVALRLLPPLAPGPFALEGSLVLFGASALLMPAPLLIRLSGLPEVAATLLAWSGYLAMGVFSSLIVLTLLRDALLVLATAATWVRPGLLDAAQFSHASALVVLVLTAVLSLVGVINARRIARVVEVELPVPELPDTLQGFTIVQISDVHVGHTIKRGYVESIVRRVNALHADLIAITGDLVDGSVARLREHVAPLAELRSRLGTFCVTGNHEYYHGIAPWLEEWHRLGLRTLINENVTLEHRGTRMLIGGVADYSAQRFEPAHRSDAAAAARTDETVGVKVLLAHQPRSAPDAARAGFHIQLSGHTHGGQFLPWPLLVPMQQPFVAGLRRLGSLLVYTSRGTGYWGPPIRFGAPSEITRHRLVKGPLPARDHSTTKRV